MDSATIYYMVVGVLVVLNVMMICEPAAGDSRAGDDSEHYDRDGNHAYYDRKIIRRKRGRSASPSANR